jgi:hypothetical protein
MSPVVRLRVSRRRVSLLLQPRLHYPLEAQRAENGS